MLEGTDVVKVPYIVRPVPRHNPEGEQGAGRIISDRCVSPTPTSFHLNNIIMSKVSSFFTQISIGVIYFWKAITNLFLTDISDNIKECLLFRFPGNI